MDRNPKETARKMAEEALSRLAADLDAARSEVLTNHLAAMSRFRKYSWNNVLLITTQRPDATRVAGIHIWNDLGRRIKKSEKGIVTLVPGAAKQESAPAETPTKGPFGRTDARAAYVFDVSQTEGKPMPEFLPGDPQKPIEQ